MEIEAGRQSRQFGSRAVKLLHAESATRLAASLLPSDLLASSRRRRVIFRMGRAIKVIPNTSRR